jgi:molybdate transport system substrate-binding protein
METITIGAGDALNVLSAGALFGALTSAANAYHQKTGRAFVIAFDTAGGLNTRASAGEAPDLFASSMDSLRFIAGLGALDGEARALGSARIALGVRTGETAPDISTLDKFKAVLLAAKTISRGDPAGGGTAGKHFADTLAHMGVMDEVAAKSVLSIGGKNVMGVVAKGLADFGITQSTEIVPVEGVEIGGWLPADVQLSTVYGIAAGAKARRKDEARAFFDWLAGPEGARHISEAGFFPA